MKTSIFTLFYFITVFNVLAQGQPFERTFGITASIQSSHSDLQFPIVISERFVFVPVLGIGYAQQQGVDIVIGLQPRLYVSHEYVSPYMTVGLLSFMRFPEGSDSVLDFVLETGFGGEYFIAPAFSVGAEASIHVAKSGKRSLRFGNPDRITAGTATSLFATIYF